MYHWASGDQPTLVGFLVFRFMNEEDRHLVQRGDPWAVGGAVLALEEWRPNFKPGRRRLQRQWFG